MKNGLVQDTNLRFERLELNQVFPQGALNSLKSRLLNRERYTLKIIGSPSILALKNICYF